MSLAAGTRLGPYEIQSFIGAGGMGEVYKGRDTRLDRTVAIKILPPAVAGDPERRARFEREAKTVASLNHPHICSLHDVGDHDGSMFLVMEHIPGETLSQRLGKGPLPLDQALTTATEIADALSAAHRQGVIHRDLKPGNIMLTKSGAKLLDFGLAKLKVAAAAFAAPATVSVPTQEPATSAGTIVGTVPYTSPEQLEGKDADARSDIFSFGTVLYEMLTGKRAFEGESHASVLAAILDRDPPPPSSITPLTPPVLDRLVRQCLAKSPDERPDTAHDVANELRWMREASGTSALARPTPERGRRWRVVAAIVVLCLAAALLGAIVTYLLRPSSAGRQVARLTLDVRPAEDVNSGTVSSTSVLVGGHRTAMVWTPDGRALLYVGRRGGVQQLYIRPLDAAEGRPLAGTEGARVPAVSPDGRWVAFWANGALQKVSLLERGPAMQLASGIDDVPFGLALDAKGTLYFGLTEIWKIEPGGVRTRVTKLQEAETEHRLPTVLPDGRTLLYTVATHDFTSGDEQVVAQALDTGQRTVVLRDAVDARYIPTGHLVFMRQGVLSAVPFDPKALKVLGEPVPLVEGVAQAIGTGDSRDNSSAGQFAVAATGNLAWLVGGPGSPAPKSLVALDRQGHVLPLKAPAKGYGHRVRVSPDGRQLLVNVTGIRDISLWTYNLEREITTQALHGGEAAYAMWAPDGRSVVFAYTDNGRGSISSLRLDGGVPVPLSSVRSLVPASFTPDGLQLICYDTENRRLFLVTVKGDGPSSVVPFANVPDGAVYPELSPDGRWLTFTVNESGQPVTYVQPYPGPGPRTPVSMPGSWAVAWRKDGRAMFFLFRPEGQTLRMVEAQFEPGTPPRVAAPKPLFDVDLRALFFSPTYVRGYDVSPDGQRFFVLRREPVAPLPPSTHINIVLNWFEELKAKVPSRR